MYRDHERRLLRTALVAGSLALALTVFTPASGYAQDTGTQGTARQVQHPTPPPTGIVETGAWTVTPMLGFGFGGDLENSPLAVGFSGAYNWSPRIGFEGELGYARGATQGVIAPFSSGVTTGSINALYHFSAENWAPYATIGLGFGHAHDAPLGVDAGDTTLMVNFGGGVKTSLTERVNLRLGMRYYNGNDFVPSFWRPYVGLTFAVGRTVR